MIIKDYCITTIEQRKYPRYPLINTIGYEKRFADDPNSYEWDCRKSNESVCIFQYTCAGSGEITINNKTFAQNAGDIFMVERPGPYAYRIAPDADYWEFKFINFTFSMMPFWNPIVSNFGHYYRLGSEDNEVMETFNRIFNLVEQSVERIDVGGEPILQVHPFNSFLDNSMMAYEFVTVLHRFLLQNGTASVNAESVQLCVEFIDNNFSRPIMNHDIAAAGYISPYYLNKRFKEVVGDTPLQYLTKVRLQNAMSMLFNRNYSIDEIARQSGFKNANYFSKVFKKYTNMNPSEFRESKCSTIILQGVSEDDPQTHV